MPFNFKDNLLFFVNTIFFWVVGPQRNLKSDFALYVPAKRSPETLPSVPFACRLFPSLEVAQLFNAERRSWHNLGSNRQPQDDRTLTTELQARLPSLVQEYSDLKNVFLLVTQTQNN